MIFARLSLRPTRPFQYVSQVPKTVPSFTKSSHPAAPYNRSYSDTNQQYPNYIIKVETRVLDIVRTLLLDDHDRVSMTSTFANDLKFNSADVSELFSIIEAEFCVQIPKDTMARIVSVKDIVHYLSQKEAKS